MAPRREEAMTSRDVVTQVNKYTTPTASRNAKTKTLKKKPDTETVEHENI